MKNISKKLALLAMACSITFLQSCKTDEIVTLPNEFTNGVLVIEQGNFSNGTGTLSFINKNNNTITNNVYGKKNGSALGSVLQSMKVIDGSAYLIVNNANKIVVCNASNMAFETTITGTKLPRYIAKINNQKAYVSEWGDSVIDGAIRVLDIASKSFTKRIKVGNGAEQILVYGDRAYITCNGGLGNSDSLAIININADTLIGKIAIGPNPESIVMDVNNNIWILCKGQYNSTFSALVKSGSLVRYNTFTNVIDKTFSFASTSSQPTSLCLNTAKDKLYYLYESGWWSFGINAASLNLWPQVAGNFYGLQIDPITDIIYTADAKDYASNGLIRRYDIYGTKIDSFASGIIPSDFYFIK